MNTEMAQKPQAKINASELDQKADGKRTDTIEKLQPLVGERQPNESDGAVLACNDWLRLGSGRTLRRLIAYYAAQGHAANNSTRIDQNRPPEGISVGNWSIRKASLGSLKSWSASFAWQERAKTFDGQVHEIHNAHRRRAMESGFALEYVRINSLKKLAARLEQEVNEKGVFLLVEMTGKDGVVGTEEKYNSALVNDYLKVLADIAKEMGQRHRNSHLDTIVAQVERELDVDKIELAQMERMARGEHFISVLLEPYLKTE